MQITLDLPDDLGQLDQAAIIQEIAIALFQQERITLSRASKIASMDLMDFQKLISDSGICVHYDVEDFEQDMQHLRDRGWL